MGFVAYSSIFSKNYWHSLADHLSASFHSRNNQESNGPAFIRQGEKKTEKIKREVENVLDDTAKHNQHFSLKTMLDPLAILGGLGAIYAHYKHSKATYNGWLDRQEILKEQRKLAAERKTAFKDEVREEVTLQVIEALKEQGLTPHQPTPAATEGRIHAPEQAPAGSFADKHPSRPATDEKTLATSGMQRG